MNKENRILIIIKIFNAANLCLCYAPSKCGKFDVSQCFFQFCFRYLEIWHLLFIPHCMYTNREGDKLFSLFALSELLCTKNVFYPILLFPLLSHPKLITFWSITDRQISTPLVPLVFSFFHWVRGALPAGATLLGWPNYGVDGSLNKQHSFKKTPTPWSPPAAGFQRLQINRWVQSLNVVQWRTISATRRCTFEREINMIFF